MIWKLWLKIMTMFLLVTLPIGMLHYFQQKDGLEIIASIYQQDDLDKIYGSYLKALKKLAHHEPESTPQLKKDFDLVLQAKQALNDLALVQNPLMDSIVFQAMRNVLIAVLLLAFIAFFLAKSIVKSYSALIDENTRNSQKAERLKSIRVWQRIARTLVHELRGPITPIKLVASSLEEKNETMAPEIFKNHLSEGVSLISEQVKIIEKMILSFTKFSKLPDPLLKIVTVRTILESFVNKFQDYSDGKVVIICDEQIPQNLQTFVDTTQIEQVFFNLLKNAVEANPNEDSVEITLSVKLKANSVGILFKNTGSNIPVHLRDQLFDLNFSTKSKKQENMGIGLTVAKKIALDHGGDLTLVDDISLNGTCFQIELPRRDG